MTATAQHRVLMILVALVALAAAPALARPASGAFGNAPAVTPWKAVAASGPVQARSATLPDAPWRAVGRGDELTPLTLVETGRKGRVTLTRSASLLVIDPDSRVELPGESYGELETSVVQTRGSVLYEVDRRSNPHFEVVTPYLVAGVKGTAFLVTVNERYAAVTVQRGRVEITDPGTGDSLMLGPGESVLRHHDEVEMDLVRDRQRSRQARKESKRLDRMDRRDSLRVSDTGSEPVSGGDRVADTKATPSLSVDDGGAGWVDSKDDRTLQMGGPGAELQREIEEITKDLIEEMIREEIKKGVIDDPVRETDPVIPGDPDLPDTPTGVGGDGKRKLQRN